MTTTKIAWAKILALLGVTGSGGVGAGYGATKHALGKAINALKEEYDTIEQEMTEKTETIQQLEKDLTREKALTRQQDTELVELKTRLRVMSEELEQTTDAVADSFADRHHLSKQLALLNKDVDNFIEYLKRWNKYNRESLARCQ